MPPKPDVSEERKDQIIEAAVNVFAREGFGHARMDDIAEEAGLSKGALYWYFKSKDAIISTIFESVFRREISRIQKMEASDLPAREMLQEYVDLVVKDLEAMEPIMPILYEFMAMAFRRKSIRVTIQKVFGEFLDVTEPLIQRGIDKGDFKNVDPLEASLTMGAIFEGAILVWSYAPEKINIKDLIESSINLLLEGLENK
jgi:AcrR family transcriptional regulator